MQPHEALTHRAAALAKIAPDHWREFLAALADFRDHHRENLVRSQLAELPVNQGKAQIITVLYDHLASSAEKMNKKG